MARIRGKGMTSNRYIVKNCPCYTLKGGYYDCWANQDTWCENITDCVIKRVIEECRWETSIDVNDRGDLAERILSSFDIEEINK